MKPTARLLYRAALAVVTVLLVLSVAVPFNSAAAQSGAPASDDFNRCSLGSAWSFENPENISGASPVITGQFSGDSIVSMTVPAGKTVTMSSRGQNSPRIMQAAADQDFDVEVRFQAPIISPIDSYKIMGILVRDATNPSQPKWLRFDYNSRSNALLTYMGYLNASGTLTHIDNVRGLTSNSPAAGPLSIKVKYQKGTGTWTVTYVVGNTGSITRTHTFLESSLGADFVVTHIGVFVGSTGGDSGGNPPGHTMKVDFFKNNANTSFVDDVIVLTVDKVGAGTVNWPMSNPNQCSGTRTVSLTATASTGSRFVNWTGDASGTQSTINVEMTASKRVVANFSQGGVPIEDLRNKIYLPLITR